MATATPIPTCPLCARQFPNVEFKPLYGVAICPDDYQKFMVKRAIAHVLDLFLYSFGFAIVFWGFFIVGGIAIGAAGGPQGPKDLYVDIFVRFWLLLFPLGIVGRLCLDGFRGHSPGKALLNLQVIDERSGRPAGFFDSFQRNLVLMVPFMPIIIGVLLFTGDGHRFGDGWAKTKVIWKDYRRCLPFLSLHDQAARQWVKTAKPAT